jgi:hypothetical protein
MPFLCLEYAINGYIFTPSRQSSYLASVAFSFDISTLFRLFYLCLAIQLLLSHISSFRRPYLFYPLRPRTA